MPAAAVSTLVVALAGNPNSGKTTIFNALTGLRQKTANYPGVTVEKKTGRCRLPDGSRADVIDLPGTYSLISRSPDEQVAMEVLRGLRPDTPPPDVVVCVVDASNLQRNLYLASQLVELGRPMVVALNMIDVAERRGIRVSAERLERQLGVPVIPIVGHRRQGIAPLKAAIARAAVAPMPDWPLPQAMKEEVVLVAGGLGILESAEESAPEQPAVRNPQSYPAIAERLLIGDRAADIAPLTGREPVRTLLDHATARLQQLGIDPMQADIEAHYRWIDEVAAASLVPACEALVNGGGMGYQPMSAGSAGDHGPVARATLDYAKAPTLTDRLDRILLHQVAGLAIFATVMAGLFVSIFWLADPVMGAVESGIAWLGGLVEGVLPDGPIKDLWTDGIVAGVGGVLVFIPQIALLFLFLAIMEDSGYLARAAFLMDRLLSKVGLHGKSFIPLLSSFACAIPGIMAARTIECRRDRLATIFVAPFMSCSARLPVYALLIGAFFASSSAVARGGILLSLYALGILAAVGTALLFKLGSKREPASSFILELPTYKRPQLSQVARVVGHNTWAFISKAGTIIFCLSVILWAMMYYPRLPAGRDDEIRTTYRDFEMYGMVANDAANGFNDCNLSVQIARDLTSYVSKGDPNDQEYWARGVRSLGPLNLNEKNERRVQDALDRRIASEQLRHSLAGRLGHAIEPVIRPLGYDWKMGVGLISAFAAREVFVSTMGIVYAAGDAEEDDTPLREAMMSDRKPDGTPVWTPLVATSLLVWFVLAMQCMSTLAIVRRETGTWTWPLLQLLYMTGLAYVASLAVYQVGSLWF